MQEIKCLSLLKLPISHDFFVFLDTKSYTHKTIVVHNWKTFKFQI